MIKNSNYIIFEKQDLEYFLKNFDVKEYINYCPNFNKIHQKKQILIILSKFLMNQPQKIVYIIMIILNLFQKIL